MCLNYKIEDQEDVKLLELAFSKTCADDRKKWILQSIKEGSTLDYTKSNVQIQKWRESGL